jgi:hypothetical protein
MEGGKRGRGGENSVKEEVAFFPPRGPHVSLAAHRSGAARFSWESGWGPMFEQGVHFREEDGGEWTTCRSSTGPELLGHLDSGRAIVDCGVWCLCTTVDCGVG